MGLWRCCCITSSSSWHDGMHATSPLRCTSRPAWMLAPVPALAHLRSGGLQACARVRLLLRSASAWWMVRVRPARVCKKKGQKNVRVHAMLPCARTVRACMVAVVPPRVLPLRCRLLQSRRSMGAVRVSPAGSWTSGAGTSVRLRWPCPLHCSQPRASLCHHECDFHRNDGAAVPPRRRARIVAATPPRRAVIRSACTPAVGTGLPVLAAAASTTRARRAGRRHIDRSSRPKWARGCGFAACCWCTRRGRPIPRAAGARMCPLLRPAARTACRAGPAMDQARRCSRCAHAAWRAGIGRGTP